MAFILREKKNERIFMLSEQNTCFLLSNTDATYGKLILWTEFVFSLNFCVRLFFKPKYSDVQSQLILLNFSQSFGEKKRVSIELQKKTNLINERAHSTYMHVSSRFADSIRCLYGILKWIRWWLRTLKYHNAYKLRSNTLFDEISIGF